VTDQVAKKQAQPKATFAVAGKATVTTSPSGLSVRVTIRGKGPDRTRAYDAFQKQLKAFIDALDAKVAHSVGSPSETDCPDPKGKQKDDRFTVTATVQVSMEMNAFGGVLKVLVEQNLPFDKPTFTFDTVETSVVELTGKAAASAREKAVALAEGAGFRLGQVRKIDCGDARITDPEIVTPPYGRGRNRWGSSFDPWSPFVTHMSVRESISNIWNRGDHTPEDLPELDQSILGLLNTDIPVQQQSASVTVEYEILPLEQAA